MDKMKKQRIKNLATIKKLNSQKLAPVQDNVNNLGADLKLLEHELQSSYRLFGAPSRDAFVNIASVLAFDIDPRLIPYKGKYQSLADFCAKVEAMPAGKRQEVISTFAETINGAHGITEAIVNDVEMRLLTRFAAFWNKQKTISESNAVQSFLESELARVKNKKVTAKTLYDLVVTTYKESLEKIEVTKAVSGKDVTTSTFLEPIDNMNESLLNLFGLPITMDNIPRKCKDYMQQYKSNLLLALDPISVNTAAENFSFDEFLSEDKTASFPTPSQIPFIVEHCRAVSDIVSIIGKEMKAVDVKEENILLSIDKIERIGEIEGVEEKDFLKYEYLVEFSAPMDVVRNTVNAIEASVENNRVLIIKKLSFNKTTDGVSNFENTLSTIQEVVKRGAKEYTSKGLIDPRPPEAKDGYGWTIIGTDNVTASLVIENVSYIGSALKAKK